LTPATRRLLGGWVSQILKAVEERTDRVIGAVALVDASWLTINAICAALSALARLNVLASLREASSHFLKLSIRFFEAAVAGYPRLLYCVIFGDGPLYGICLRGPDVKPSVRSSEVIAVGVRLVWDGAVSHQWGKVSVAK
jgi:hypothetical protein